MNKQADYQATRQDNDAELLVSNKVEGGADAVGLARHDTEVVEDIVPHWAVEEGSNNNSIPDDVLGAEEGRGPSLPNMLPLGSRTLAEMPRAQTKYEFLIQYALGELFTVQANLDEQIRHMADCTAALSRERDHIDKAENRLKLTHRQLTSDHVNAVNEHLTKVKGLYDYTYTLFEQFSAEARLLSDEINSQQHTLQEQTATTRLSLDASAEAARKALDEQSSKQFELLEQSVKTILVSMDDQADFYLSRYTVELKKLNEHLLLTKTEQSAKELDTVLSKWVKVQSGRDAEQRYKLLLTFAAAGLLGSLVGSGLMFLFMF